MKRTRTTGITSVTAIFVFILLILYPFPASARFTGIADDIPFILIDSKTGLVIAEQHADQRLRPASTTKILTAIVALENGDLEQEMKVSQQAVFDVGKGGMNIGIMAGEEGLTLRNMLNAMLIKSANETANIIAENVAPSRAEFVEMMNRKAVEIGALDSAFVNPSGKDTEKEDAGHLSTPRDMAKIARYAMTIPRFRQIVATEYYNDMPVTNKHDDWGILRNTNQFLWHDNTYPYTLDNTEHKYTVAGIKTGYTVEAGNNLVTAAVGEDGMELIAVVMHVMQPNKIYAYSKELMRYGFENYSMRTVSEAGLTVSTVTVQGASPGESVLNLVTETAFTSAFPIAEGVQAVKSKVNIDSNIRAPAKKGDILGYVEYSSHGTVLGRVSVVASKSVDAAAADISAAPVKELYGKERPYSYMLMGILLFLCGFIILRMTLRRISRRLKKKRYGQ